MDNTHGYIVSLQERLAEAERQRDTLNADLAACRAEVERLRPYESDWNRLANIVNEQRSALVDEREWAKRLEAAVRVYLTGCGDLANRSSPEDWRAALLALSARATLAALSTPEPQDAQEPEVKP